MELGGEFVDGDRLVIAAIFAIGSARACQGRLTRRARRADFPDTLRVALQHDDQRYGWFVSRTSFGTELYLAGRDALLGCRGGRSISAQGHLERCWTTARATLVGDLDEAELGLVDRVVSGKEPLPAARPSSVEGETAWPPSGRRATKDPVADAFGLAARAWSRPGYDLAPVMLTWDRAVFVVSDATRERLAFAHVPAPMLTSFTGQLKAGVLDETIRSYLAVPGGRRRLDNAIAARSEPALYDQLAPRAHLLVPERMARTPRRIENHFFQTAMRGSLKSSAALVGDKGSREFV